MRALPRAHGARAKHPSRRRDASRRGAHRDLRRSRDPSAERGVLGQRQPTRRACVLRRGQARRRYGLAPRPRPSTAALRRAASRARQRPSPTQNRPRRDAGVLLRAPKQRGRAGGAHLQHLRPAHVGQRRPRRVQLYRASAPGPKHHHLRDRRADALVPARARPRVGPHRADGVGLLAAGQHWEPGRVHHP